MRNFIKDSGSAVALLMALMFIAGAFWGRTLSHESSLYNACVHIRGFAFDAYKENVQCELGSNTTFIVFRINNAMVYKLDLTSGAITTSFTKTESNETHEPEEKKDEYQ